MFFQNEQSKHSKQDHGLGDGIELLENRPDGQIDTDKAEKVEQKKEKTYAISPDKFCYLGDTEDIRSDGIESGSMRCHKRIIGIIGKTGEFINKRQFFNIVARTEYKTPPSIDDTEKKQQSTEEVKFTDFIMPDSVHCFSGLFDDVFYLSWLTVRYQFDTVFFKKMIVRCRIYQIK